MEIQIATSVNSVALTFGALDITQANWGGCSVEMLGLQWLFKFLVKNAPIRVQFNTPIGDILREIVPQTILTVAIIL